MGYELTRFVSEIDEEFLCSICKMVLEDPIQTPCEHSFCDKCIKDWVPINHTCPVDRRQLTVNDLTSPSRPFRNLWNKLNIKCDFQPQGCQEVTKLENLALHLTSCKYNWNSEVVCDKGCNTTITRREYQINNCFSHLANRVSAQEKEIIKVRHELSDQREHFERIVNRLQDENRKLNDEIKGQHKENRKINEEVSRQRSQLEQFQKAMRLQQQPLKWRRCENVKIDEGNILKLDDRAIHSGMVESDYPLEPAKSSFKVHILSAGRWAIGLQNKAGTYISYVNDLFSITLKFEGKYETTNLPYSQKCEVGDIIECGVNFPKYFINDGNHSATVYLSKNGEIFFEKCLTIPKDWFPYIIFPSNGPRLQYYQ